MCDYSLCGLPSRLAIEGEELVAHRFSTGSLGMAPSGDPRIAPAVASRQDFYRRAHTSACLALLGLGAVGFLTLVLIAAAFHTYFSWLAVLTLFCGLTGGLLTQFQVRKFGPENPMVVCLPPGATLILSSIPQPVRSRYGLRSEEFIRFAQFEAPDGEPRDAVQFDDGRTIRLQLFMQPGMRMTVLSLAGSPRRQARHFFELEDGVVLRTQIERAAIANARIADAAISDREGVLR